MKKNLLITLGDSWTEGYGCYESWLIQKYGNPPKIDWSNSEHSKDGKLMLDYFNTNSWASLLATSLNYDLKNLGKGGQANSGSAKQFYDFINSAFDRNNYDKILVIFLITFPFRFSFYSDGIIKSWLPDAIDGNFFKYTNNYEKFIKYYISDVVKTNTDAWLETIFYIRCIEALCKQHSMDFFYGSAFSDINEMHKLYINTDTFLHPQYASYSQNLDNTDFAKCKHPNESGYKKISNLILKDLNSKDYVK